jgi:hypothetical protein
VHIFNGDVAAECAPLDLDPRPGGGDPPNGERGTLDLAEFDTDGRRCIGGLTLDGLQERPGVLQDFGVFVSPGRR